MSDEAFEAMVARGELLEWARFAGKMYGTPRAPVEERVAAGVPTLLEIEAGREFDITLVNTSVEDVRQQLVVLMTA